MRLILIITAIITINTVLAEPLPPKNQRKTIGVWYDRDLEKLGGTDCTRSIQQAGNKFYLIAQCKGWDVIDGTPLSKSGQRTYRKIDSRAGDHYVIQGDGNLTTRDNDGLIEVLPKTQNQSISDKTKKDAEKLQGFASRESHANALEERFLRRGFDVYVSVTGKYKTILNLKFVLMSRPIVYQLSRDRGFIDELRNVGFTRVVFTDGYRDTWTLDL